MQGDRTRHHKGGGDVVIRVQKMEGSLVVMLALQMLAMDVVLATPCLLHPMHV